MAKAKKSKKSKKAKKAKKAVTAKKKAAKKSSKKCRPGLAHGLFEALDTRGQRQTGGPDGEEE